MKRNKLYLGIDLGATWLRVGLIDESGRLLSKKKIATPSSKKEFLIQIKLLIDQLKRKSDIAGLGIGAPGPLDLRQGKILNSPNLPQLHQLPIKKLLDEIYHLPIQIDNDANCALVGEAWQGDPSLVVAKKVMMITIGSGIGGAVMEKGQIVHSAYGSLELGHVKIKKSQNSCPLGHHGCLESLIGGKTIAQKTGQSLELIFKKASRKDQLAQKIITQWQNDLTLGLKKIIQRYQPTVIVLGGGIIAKNSAIILRLNLPVKMQIAKLGDDAGIFGAAKLFF